MLADLHCHSTWSDGSCTPEMLVRLALRKKLSYLALTDHDTMQGVIPCRKAAEGTALTVIPGVECTTKDAETGRSVHVLCYAPKKPDVLDDLMRTTSERRRAAKIGMMEKLEKLYPDVRVEDAEALSENSASMFESHVMTALANAGVTNQPFGPLLKSLIGKHGSCYVPIQYPDTLETIALMHRAGGFVVIAHPGQFDSMALTRRLAREKMIDGIECRHYRNDENVTKECLALCARYDLAVTGGSDFHGANSVSPHPLACCHISGKEVDVFLRRLDNF